MEVPLPTGGKGYGRVLKSPLMAFYSAKAECSLPAEDILRKPIAFRVWVMRSAIDSGRWPVVGHAPLEPELQTSPMFFKQDAISKAFTLYRDGAERPATLDECNGLECAAAWSAQHVESRLEDHLMGRPNKWVESLKPRAP